ncbi:MAG: family 43 glycosylhydrolase [Pedobacter sp.]|nr:family 43 glycosylhydrolase [Pedobacter sp.]
MSYKIIIRVFLVLPFLCLLSFRSEKKPSTSLAILQKGKHIVWDQQTLRKVSSSEAGRSNGYGRIIQLADKSLICVYESAGNTVAVTSNDLGASWSSTTTIAARHDGISMAVPDLLQLRSGKLIVFYNPRPGQKSLEKKFGIRCKMSDDGGKNWSAEQSLYDADWQFENGCWEPSAVQLPNGEIQLFFANESDYRKSNEQNISMLRSADNGVSWTKEREVVSFRKGFRDGMPVPILLNNQQEVVFAIEDNSSGNFKPYIIRSSLRDNWSALVNGRNDNRSYALAEKIDNKIYAGAPYLRQLKSGETILSYQGTEGRINMMQRADMKVVIGDQYARNFGAKSVPFLIPADKSCLWNSLSILDDDTIIAITSTNAHSDRSEIWMIKGRLVSDEENDSKILLMADPTVFLDKGTYYLYGTSSNKGFQSYVSSDLKNWSAPKDLNGAMVLRKGEAFGNGGFWAPQVFKHKELYYMAYTADEQIAIATSSSPLGPFKQKVLKSLSGTGKQIDPYLYFDGNGKVYLYHVKLQTGNRIFVVEMKADLSDVILGTEKECISGTDFWENTERTGWPVTEGPTVVKHNNLYYLIYSANDFRSKDYAVGYATSWSPLGPWQKYSGNPIISRIKLGLNGSGHGDLFTDKKGALKYVLHVHNSNVKVSPRATGLIGIKFRKVAEGDDILEVDSTSFKLLKLN